MRYQWFVYIFYKIPCNRKKYSALAICQAVEKPHAFKKEFNEFLEEREGYNGRY